MEVPGLDCLLPFQGPQEGSGFMWGAKKNCCGPVSTLVEEIAASVGPLPPLGLQGAVGSNGLCSFEERD